MIKLVKVGEDLKMLSLVTVASFPLQQKLTEVSLFFFPSCSPFSIQKTPNKQIKRKL